MRGLSSWAGIALVCLLASCSPGLLGPGVTVAQQAADVVARDPARALITPEGLSLFNDGAEAMTGDTSRAGDRLAVVITAAGQFNPATAAPGACAASNTRGYYVCYLPAIPAGASAVITSPTGQAVSCTVLYYRTSTRAYLYTKPCKPP